MGTGRATTPSQTTSSSQCPASTRARRHTRQNLSSVWRRGWWTWGICAIKATPTRPRSDRVRCRRRTRRQTQTGRTKRLRDRQTCPKLSKRRPRYCWRGPTRIKWKLRPRPQRKDRAKDWEQVIETSGNSGLKCVFWCSNNCIIYSWSLHCDRHTVLY